MEILTDPHAWISLLTLAIMEKVLGINNLIFVAVLVERLPRRSATEAVVLEFSWP